MTRPCPPTPEHLRLAPGGEASWTQAYEMLAHLVELSRYRAQGEDLHLFVAHALLRARSEGTHPAAPGMPRLPFEAAVTDPGTPAVDLRLIPGGACIYMHGTPDDPIDTLFNVHPMPVEDLPRVCACGATFHYAESLVFVTVDRFNTPGDAT